MTRQWLVFFGVSGFLLAGDGLVQKFERRAAEEIATKLQGAAKVVIVKADISLGGFWGQIDSVTIRASHFSTQGLPLFTEPQRSQSGRVDRLRIELTDFKLKKLPVESLVADIPSCRYDFGLARDKRQIRLSKSGIGVGTVRINERGLEEFILAKYKEIKRVKVSVLRDKVLVDGYGEFLIVKSDFQVLASLKVVDGDKLVLDNARIWFAWVRADDFARDTLLQTLNPVVDLRKDLGLLDAVRVERLKVRDGVIEASGAVKIPERPGAETTDGLVKENWAQR